MGNLKRKFKLWVAKRFYPEKLRYVSYNRFGLYNINSEQYVKTFLVYNSINIIGTWSEIPIGFPQSTIDNNYLPVNPLHNDLILVTITEIYVMLHNYGQMDIELDKSIIPDFTKSEPYHG